MMPDTNSPKSGLGDMRSGQHVNIYNILNSLVADKLITEQQSLQCQDLVSQQSSKDQTLPLIRISEQAWQSATSPSYPLTLEKLTQWFAKQVDLEYLRIDPLKIDVQAVTKIVSQAYAKRFSFLPVLVNDNEVTIATTEPWINDWVDDLQQILRRDIKRVIANPKDILRYQDEFYGVSRSIYGASNSNKNTDAHNFEQLTELGQSGEPDANDQHIVHLVDWLLQYAFEQRASDIHLEPRRDKSKIRFRIDGVLHQVNEIPTAIMIAITSRLKSLGRMDIADKRRPQDGRIKTKTPAGKEIEMRLSTMPTTFGEKMVLRIFDPQVLSRSFTELGFTKLEKQRWQQLIDQPNGIILVTGPTGSGKTTTLYSALRQLARPEVNICTIEDPIEMVEPQFNQMQVQAQIDVNFASGIRTLLRQDPDIIMIGEIRDREPADIAIQASLTGHLVLSTLHTNDAPSAITRLIDIDVEPFLIAATLNGIVAQRLVRTLCPHCKQPGKINADSWHALVSPNKIAIPKKVFKAVGCDECRHTGYLGRIGIYEILVMNKELRRAIKASVNHLELREIAVKHGMRRLQLAAANKIAAGVTTLEEVFTVVPAIDEDEF